MKALLLIILICSASFGFADSLDDIFKRDRERDSREFRANPGSYLENLRKKQEARIAEQSNREFREKLDNVWWEITNAFDNVVEAICDIRLRDWLFLLLLFPVSLWAAKQVGIDKAISNVWRRVAEARKRRKSKSLRKGAEFALAYLDNLKR